MIVLYFISVRINNGEYIIKRKNRRYLEEIEGIKSYLNLASYLVE